MRKRSMAAALFMLLLACGCAVGNKHNYSNVVADLRASGSSSVSVATHDQRPYVVSGEKPPQFVGLQRGGFGNPFSVSTLDDKPLADDITRDITASLAKKGFHAIPVIVLPSDSGETVLQKSKAAAAERSIIVTLLEWKTDTYSNVALLYDVSLSVYAKDGQQLAQKNIKGRDNLGGSAWNPPAHAKQAVPVALRQKLEELLNSPEISKTLQ